MRPFFSRIKHIVYYRLPVAALCIAIFRQSSHPGLVSVSLFPHQDKVMHFFVYGLLSFLTARALSADRPLMPPGTVRMIALGFSCLYGLSDEIHQAFVPSRNASILDFAADCLGSAAGAWLYLDICSTRFKRNV